MSSSGKATPESVEMEPAAGKALRVAARATILDVRLFRTSAELHSIPTKDSRLTWSVDAKPSVEYSEGDDYSIIRIDFEVSIQEEPGSGDPDDDSEDLADLSFQFGALYTLDTKDLDSPIEPEEISAYARSGTLDTLFPYAREYVHDVTMRLGLPPLVMGIQHAVISK
jgi:hypothetical protein